MLIGCQPGCNWISAQTVWALAAELLLTNGAPAKIMLAWWSCCRETQALPIEKKVVQKDKCCSQAMHRLHKSTSRSS